jgi:hypothetical protein
MKFSGNGAGFKCKIGPYADKPAKEREPVRFVAIVKQSVNILLAYPCGRVGDKLTKLLRVEWFSTGHRG